MEHLVMSGSGTCLNKKEKYIAKAPKPTYERAPSSQIWNNLSNKMTVLDYNPKNKINILEPMLISITICK